MATPTDNVVALIGNPLIDGLTWGAAWQFAGGAHTLTYSLSLNDNPSGGAWTTALSNAARLALAEWSDVANVSFVESGSGTVYTQSSADLALILTGGDIQSIYPGAVGLGIPPSPSYANDLLAAVEQTRTTYPKPEGDVALDNYYGGFNYLDPGGVGLTIMLHEIGHALGLKHVDDAHDGRPTFASLGISNLNSNLYTVMSYTGVNGLPLGTDVLGNAATPMPLDILAVQQIYGANTSYHTGDDTYTFFGLSPAMAWTIWDAGGNDTLSASNLNQYNNVTLDLREGHYSQSPTISGVTVAIAYGTVIENAIGGAGDDTLFGNAANNRLDGGAGNDTMTGGAGDDTYVVDSAGDLVSELAGEGTDTVLSSVSYVVPNNVENLTLTGSASLTGQGNSLNNVLTGNAGNSTLIGGAGDDVLLDGAGVASMQGGIGNDSYYISSAVVIPGTGWSYVGQPGDYISQGQTVSFAGNTLQWQVLMHDQTNDGLIDNLTLWGQDTSGNHSFRFSVTADQIGENLVPGAYADARRANVGYAGYAGLEFSTEGRGSNQVFGSFVINDLSIDYAGSAPSLTRFSATFQQHSESPVAPLLIGNIRYGEPDSISTSTIVELPGEGTDQVFSFISYALSANVENLTLTGSNAISGVGNESNNAITGNSANNQLTGGLGNDTLIGGLGLDTAIYSGPRSAYTITKVGTSYTVNDSVNGRDGTDTLSGIERLQFSDGLIKLGNLSVDPNGDGKSDLLIRNSDGTTLNWLMNGSQTSSSTMLLGGGNWSIANGHGDYDGDGKNDLIVRNTDGSTRLWLMNGSQISSNTTLLGAGAWSILGAGTWSVINGHGDYNGDGKTDLLVQNSDGTTLMWLMNGSQTLGNTTLLGPGAWSIIDGQGDYDGDGKSDLLVRNSNGTTLMWLMNGTQTSSSTTMLGAGNWSIIDGHSDTNGDGKSDLLVQNSNGTTLLWQMNGSQTSSSTTLLGAGAWSAWQSEQGGVLSGDANANTLTGTTGNDSLYGNAGNDTLTGGAGSDSFVFNTALNAVSNVDTIADFSPGADRIVLDHLIFSALATGTLAPASFVAEAGAVAHDGNDYLLYDTTTGDLSYDPDGSGAQLAILFAHLNNHPAISAADLVAG